MHSEDSTILRSTNKHPLFVVALRAYLCEVRAERVFDHVVRDLGESVIVVSIRTFKQRTWGVVKLTSTSDPSSDQPSSEHSRRLRP
jgi:hypothetical protein